MAIGQPCKGPVVQNRDSNMVVAPAWALYALPVWISAAGLGGLVVFVAIGGLIKPVTITLTPPRR